MVGPIDTWEPLERRLKIGGRLLWVASSVSVIGLSPGTRVTLSGHQEHQTARWIVTLLRIDGLRPQARDAIIFSRGTKSGGGSHLP